MSVGLCCLLKNTLPHKVWRCLGARLLQLPGTEGRKMSNGSIRDGGGAFAKREEVLEELYFRKREKELIDSLKSHHEEQITAQHKEIKRLQEAIKWHESKVEELEDKKSSPK